MQVLSHNVRRLRFELQSPKHKFGLPVGKHVFIYAKCAQLSQPAANALPNRVPSWLWLVWLVRALQCTLGSYESDLSEVRCVFAESIVKRDASQLMRCCAFAQGEERDGRQGLLASQQR